MKDKMCIPCSYWVDKLTATHPGDLSSAERTTLAEHIALCPACSAVSTEYRAMSVFIRHLSAPDPPAELPPRLLQLWEGQNHGDNLYKQESPEQQALVGLGNNVEADLKEPLGTSSHSSDPAIEEILTQFDSYIIMLVQKKACSSSNVAHPGVLDLEIDEIIQRVRIKFWKALLTKGIEYHKAYIQSIVSNEFNDLGRRRKARLPLSTNEDGELYVGNVLLSENRELADSAIEFEKEEVMDNLMVLTTQVIIALPPQMHQAMINHVTEQVDNLARLTKAFEEHRVNIRTMKWLDDSADTKRLKASISPARHRYITPLSNTAEEIYSGLAGLLDRAKTMS